MWNTFLKYISQGGKNIEEEVTIYAGSFHDGYGNDGSTD